MKSQVLASLALLAFAGCTWAQTAGLSGSITDPSQAPIPKATVTITAPSTGFTRTAQTNETGLYTFTYLQPGVYNITVTTPGLKHAGQRRRAPRSRADRAN
jgi:protocatechuate 3,4-dioxygenase beta subunit